MAPLFEKIGLRPIGGLIRSYPRVIAFSLFVSLARLAFLYFSHLNRQERKETQIEKTKDLEEAYKRGSKLEFSVDEKGVLTCSSFKALLVNAKGNPADRKGNAIPPRDEEADLPKMLLSLNGKDLLLMKQGVVHPITFSLKGAD